MASIKMLGLKNTNPYKHLRRLSWASLFVLSFWGTSAVALEFTPPSKAPTGRLQGTETHLFEPETEGKPGRLEGAGTRGGCPTSGEFTLLLPPNYFGLTLQASPSFYMYVPTRCEVPVELTLLDKQKQEVLYQTTIETTGVPGVVRVDLDNSQAPALELGKTYYWEATLVMSGDLSDRSADVYDFGWIRRVEPTEQFQSQLQNASDLEKAKLFAETGIWYDALDLLAELRLQSENNCDSTYGEMPSDSYSYQWQELLRSVNLDRVAKSPLTFPLQPQEDTNGLDSDR
jgi:hypothetical protein